MAKIYDTLIIGGGPAGLSAALGLGRVHRTCVVFSNSKFRNSGAPHSHTLLTRDHIPPADIRSIGREELDRYGNTEYVETTISRLSKTTHVGINTFTAEDESGNVWKGRTVVLAMGSKDILPDIPGYAENWPFNIYQCLFCDGHERQGLPKGVLAYPWSAMYTTMASLAHYQSMPPGADHVPVKGQESSVTIFTNGEKLNEDDEGVKKMRETSRALGITVEERKIEKLVKAKGEGLDVVFEDGSSLSLGFMVHKPPTMPNAEPLIEQLGVEMTENKDVKRGDPMGTTNVQGVYVAGDVGTFFKQVSAAIMHGVAAAGGIAHELTAQDNQIALARYEEMSV